MSFRILSNSTSASSQPEDNVPLMKKIIDVNDEDITLTTKQSGSIIRLNNATLSRQITLPDPNVSAGVFYDFILTETTTAQWAIGTNAGGNVAGVNVNPGASTENDTDSSKYDYNFVSGSVRGNTSHVLCDGYFWYFRGMAVVDGNLDFGT